MLFSVGSSSDIPDIRPSAKSGLASLTLTDRPSAHFYAMINYEDAYVQPLILAALASQLPPDSYTLINTLAELPTPASPLLQIQAYESLSFEQLLDNPATSLANAYIIRKALIRKHYLSNTADNWIAKHPESILATNMKPSCDFELDYAEFLDDALVEAWELQKSFAENEGKVAADREWWILKPGMSDRGQGIRLFSTEEELQTIFEEWEADAPDSDDEDEGEGETIDDNDALSKPGKAAKDDYIVTSHLRHFIAQPYIHPPLLLALEADFAPRKFHVRTYVLAVGGLKVYVYKPMLALFAAEAYVAPWTTSGDSKVDSEEGAPELNLKAHLTNTCLQDGTRDGAVQSFWSLPSDLPSTGSTSSTSLPPDWKDTTFAQICETTGSIFEAASRSSSIHFQALPNAFEVFGLDFLVDEMGTAWMLEVNAFPDFRQTGGELRDIVGGLWEGVVREVVGDFFGLEGLKKDDRTGDMVLVKDIDLGRR